MTGILAEANAREMTSLRAWCLVIRLGAVLHAKAWTPHVFTCDPHRQVRAAQRPRPSRKSTATRTASSSRRRPHETIGSANSQSPISAVTAMIVGCSDWVFPDEAKKQEEQAKQSISLPCHPLQLSEKLEATVSSLLWRDRHSLQPKHCKDLDPEITVQCARKITIMGP